MCSASVTLVNVGNANGKILLTYLPAWIVAQKCGVIKTRFGDIPIVLLTEGQPQTETSMVGGR